MRTPPLWFRLIVVAFLGISLWGLRPDPPDQAVANLIAFSSGFVACVALLVWYSFFSGLGRIARFTPLVIVAICIAVAARTVRFVQLSGTLIPTKIAWRWTPQADATLEKPKVTLADQEIDLATTTPNDYPQFLGPERSNSVNGVELDTDWERHPPKKLWRQKIGAGWSAFSVVGPYAVTMEQRGADELVTCYEVRTGRLRWSHAIPARHEETPGGIGPRCTPTIHEGKVYALGATGVLRCLDGANGQLIWQKDLLAAHGLTQEQDEKLVQWGRAASPLVVLDKVIVPAGGAEGALRVSLAAYDCQDGKFLWEGGEHQVSYSSPALATLAGKRQILIVNESCVAGHDPDTGRQLWEHPWFGESNGRATASQAVAVSPDRVFISKGYSTGSALLQLVPDGDKWKVKELWADPTAMKTKYTNVAVKDGYVYGLSDGILECIELETGARQWKSGRYGHGQMLMVGDLLLVQAETGEVLLVEASPNGHHELASFQALEGTTWNNPALAGHYLLVRNAEEAACYELPRVDH